MVVGSGLPTIIWKDPDTCQDLLSKAGVSPSYMNHFLQMHSAFSFKQFSEVIYLLCSGHLLLTTLSLGCFWKNSDNWVPCRKNFISGLHVLVNSYSYTAQYKPYSTDFPWALKMKKKFAIISFRNSMLGNGLDYSRERVACRRTVSPQPVICWEQVGREQVGYGALGR